MRPAVAAQDVPELSDLEAAYLMKTLTEPVKITGNGEKEDRQLGCAGPLVFSPSSLLILSFDEPNYVDFAIQSTNENLHSLHESSIRTHSGKLKSVLFSIRRLCRRL